jgi:hypothetical protein
MDAFGGTFVFFAALFLAGILAGALALYWWTIIRVRKIARLEMKRHVQRIGTL